MRTPLLLVCIALAACAVDSEDEIETITASDDPKADGTSRRLVFTLGVDKPAKDYWLVCPISDTCDPQTFISPDRGEVAEAVGFYFRSHPDALVFHGPLFKTEYFRREDMAWLTTITDYYRVTRQADDSLVVEEPIAVVQGWLGGSWPRGELVVRFTLLTDDLGPASARAGRYLDADVFFTF
jgi:hypothetical protein